MLRGENDIAWSIINKLHHDSTDPLEEAAHAEFTQIVWQVEFDKREDSGYIQMFKKPSWRRRTLSAMFIMWATPKPLFTLLTCFKVCDTVFGGGYDRIVFTNVYLY